MNVTVARLDRAEVTAITIAVGGVLALGTSARAATHTSSAHGRARSFGRITA
jgi:hypothetical protein